MTRVVIAGSGFGGLDTALKLREKNKKLEIIVIDKKPFFIYQVSLHELMSGKVNKKKIAIDLEKLYRKNNIRFLHEDIVEVKPLEKALVTMTRKIKFDYLVIAFGGVTNYYGIEGMEENSYQLKSTVDAIRIRKRLEEEVEKSKYYHEPINVVVCGGGLTGIETASELADLAKGNAQVVLLESLPTIMSGFNKESIQYAMGVLKKKGVKVAVSTTVRKNENGKLTMKDGKKMYSSLTVWCGGVKPNPLTKKTRLRLNEQGAIMVNDYLQTSHPHIYALGDCSYSYKNPQPWTALTSIHQADVVAHNIGADIKKQDKKHYEEKDPPYLISIGRGYGMMIRNKSVKTGFIPSLIKKFIEKQYLFTRKHWYWPFSKIDFK